MSDKNENTLKREIIKLILDFSIGIENKQVSYSEIEKIAGKIIAAIIRRVE